MDGRPARSPDDKMDKYLYTIIFALKILVRLEPPEPLPKWRPWILLYIPYSTISLPAAVVGFWVKEDSVAAAASGSFWHFWDSCWHFFLILKACLWLPKDSWLKVPREKHYLANSPMRSICGKCLYRVFQNPEKW